MKREAFDGTEERAVITGMITNTAALGRIASHWEAGQDYFAQRWVNALGGMCVRYHREHGEAPGNRINTVFGVWAERQNNKDNVPLVEKFLAALSDEYDRRASEVDNADYITDLAAKHFTKVRGSRLAEEIRQAVESGRVEEIEEAHKKFKRVEFGQGAVVNPFTDKESIRECLESPETSIIPYGGAAGEFFGNALCKGGFVAFLAREKLGKSQVLLDLAVRAATNRLRTVFFGIGDMTKNQIMRRFVQRVARRPINPKTIKYPLSVRAEVSKLHVEHEERSYESRMTAKEAEEAVAKVVSNKIKSSEDYFKLYTCPAGSLSVDKLANTFEDWCQSGWVPDVLVIDYADLLFMPGGKEDFRHRSNENWMKLRALSSHPAQPLLVTATQANREAYKVSLLGMEHVGEDKRKLAHVTALYGLNCKPDEKQVGVIRLNPIAVREDEFHTNRCVYWAQCLSISNPCVKSCFLERAPPVDDDEVGESRGSQKANNRLNGRANGRH